MRKSRPETKASMKSFRELRVFIPFITKYPFWVSMTIVSLVVTALSNLVVPIFAGRIFDGLAGQAGDLKPYFLVAIFALLIMGAGGFTRVYFSQMLSFRVITDIRSTIFGHVIGLSRAFFDQNRSGELTSRLSGDVRDVGFILSSSVSSAARQMLVFLGGLAMLFYTSPSLTWKVLLVLPLVILPMAVFSRRLRTYSRMAHDSFAEASSLGAEAIQNAAIVQSYDKVGHIRGLYNAFNEDHFASHKKRILTYAFIVAYFIICVFGAVIFVFWSGANMVISGEMSQGVLVQFVFYAMMVGGAAQSFSDIWGELTRAAGAAERLAELLKSEESIVIDHQAMAPVKGASLLELKNIGFSYPLREEDNILEDVSLKIEKGQTIALVGPSGAGKSTIIQLLMRHYDTKSGDILLNGQDIKKISLSDLRQNFAYVSQDPAVFAMSIHENIAFARPNASRDDIIRAAKSAYADEFISELKDGYDSQVGERGVLLSGGQKARLVLARAFLSDAPILLLDEATAALDAQSEAYIQKAVEELAHTRTVIAIAHRFATVKSADIIAVVEKGRITQTGTHAELLKKSKTYAQLAKMQFLGDGTKN